MTARVWADAAHRVLGRGEGELRDHLWIAWLVQDRVLNGHALPLEFPKAAFPRGLSLYPLDPLNQLGITLATPAVGLLPAVAILTTGLLVLIGIGAARLATALGASPRGALAATGLAMMGPPVLGAFVDTQTEGMGVGWMLLLLAELAAPGPWSPGRAARTGAFGAALMASAPYQAHGITIVAVPLFLWRAWRSGARVRTLAVTGAPIIGMAILLGVAMWSAESDKGGQLASRGGHRDEWPPRTQIGGVLVAPELTTITPDYPRAVGAYARTPVRAPPSTGPRPFSGWALPILAIGVAVARPRARVVLAGALLYGLLAAGSSRAFGPVTAPGGLRIPLPYDLFYWFYPLAGYAWKPAQYAVPAWCIASAAVSLLPGNIALVGAMVVFIELQVRGPTPLPLPVMELVPPPVYADIRAASDGAVLEFPCRARSRAGRDAMPNDVLLGQIFHGKPIGETFRRRSNAVGDGVVEALADLLHWPTRDHRDLDAMWRRATAVNFRWLVIHGRMLTEAEGDALDAAIGPRSVARTDYDDGIRLYEMRKFPAPAVEKE